MTYFLDFLVKSIKKNITKDSVVFMHNLGKFDGFHLICNFVKNKDLVGNLHTIIDKRHNYI